MATPLKPFAKSRLGILEDILSQGVSEQAALLSIRITTHRSKGAVPGLLAMGPAGLSEGLVGATISSVTRGLKELQSAGIAVVDAASTPPLIYIRGSVEVDPPAHENSVKGMVKQLRLLPDSHVRREVVAAIRESLGLHPKFLPLWESLSQGLESGPQTLPKSGTELGPLRLPPSADPPSALKSTAARAAAHTEDTEATHKLLLTMFDEVWEHEDSRAGRVEAVKTLLVKRRIWAQPAAINHAEEVIAFRKRMAS